MQPNNLPTCFNFQSLLLAVDRYELMANRLGLSGIGIEQPLMHYEPRISMAIVGSRQQMMEPISIVTVATPSMDHGTVGSRALPPLYIMAASVTRCFGP